MAHLLLLIIIYVAFISLGLPDGMLGVAWPAMRVDWGQPLAALGLLTLTLTVCSGLASFYSGPVLKRLGTGRVVTLSGFLTALALLGFSVAPSLGFLLVLAIPMGLGAGAVDAGLNHFVAQHYSSRHMSWLHGFWGLGATLGPILMSAALAGKTGWSGGYQMIGSIQLALAVVLWFALPLWQTQKETASTPADCGARPNNNQPVRALALWLAPLTFMLYVAAEMATGLWAASILVDQRHLSATTAGLWLSGFYGALTAGRFALGLLANQMGNRRMVRLGIALAMAGAALFTVRELEPIGPLAGLILLGFGCAPIFPSLMHETSTRFAPDLARTVVGRQLAMAYVGSAAMPAACGVLAQFAGLGAIMPTVFILLLVLLVATEWLNRIT